MPVLSINSLEETDLFRRLIKLESDGSSPMGVSGNVAAICKEAAQRLKLFPAIHEQFTLHDEIHSLRIVQLMAIVAGSVVESLNSTEISLLILSAYLHDQGMIVEARELSEIQSSDDWIVFEENWITNHSNYSEAMATLSDPMLSPSERARAVEIAKDLRAGMFTNFIRRSHGNRSGNYIQSTFANDPRLVIHSRSIVDMLALICVSHTRPAELITAANGFQFDELVGTAKINVALLAYLLRLSDILDFDRERTPESLYRAIHFTSSVSIIEWEKHRSVSGWEISSNRITFAAQCTHPAYERAIKEFLDWIDDELSSAQSYNRMLPAGFQRYTLGLPQKVDRSRVGARIDPVSGIPVYHYFDLEFSLSRNEIVKLLMTDGLYSNKSLFVRELLQNALDALRHRDAIYRASGLEASDLKVRFEHFQDAGFDVVRCTDNGVGMDEEIIRRFLTKAGRSYYRSPEFEQERSRFRDAGCDFDPCAQFGIGFMSCFMIGDEITIHTRRDYGPARGYGRPLVVEIKGLSGIVAIRPGTSNQAPGTKVEIRSRKRSFIVNPWNDPVNLLEVLEGYALAAEYPIEGICQVPAIKGRKEIVPQTTSRPHQMEVTTVIAKEIFTIDLAVLGKPLRGEIRICTLIDAEGVPTISNDEGQIIVKPNSNPAMMAQFALKLKDGTEVPFEGTHDTNQVCCDGILVAGRPGRDGRHFRLGSHSCNNGFGSAAFLIDARGELKPRLTPARTPPDSSFRDDPTWCRLFDVTGIAYSKLLDELIERCAKSGDHGRFWLIAEAYNISPYQLRLHSAWRHLRFPVGRAGSVEWVRACDLGTMPVTFPADGKMPIELVIHGDSSVLIPDEMQLFARQNGWANKSFFEHLIMSLCTLEHISPTEIQLNVQQPDPHSLFTDFSIREMPS